MVLIAIFLLARCATREFNLHCAGHPEEVRDRIVQHTVHPREAFIAQVIHDFRRDRTAEETVAALLLDLWDGLLLCCGVRVIELLQPRQSARQGTFIRLLDKFWQYTIANTTMYSVLLGGGLFFVLILSLYKT